MNKLGIVAVKDKKQWAARLEVLSTSIEKWLAPVDAPQKTVEQVHLFYNV